MTEKPLQSSQAMKNRLFLVGLLVLSNALGQPPVTTRYGSIQGRVVDANGKPIAQALVMASAEGAQIPQTSKAVTNEDGEFFIGRAMLGVNSLYTSKEAEGYPSSMFAFHSGEDHIPIVTVVEGKTVEGVLIQLGPKSGTLVITITDTKTGRPIPYAGVRLTQADKPQHFIATRADHEGQLKRLVPPMRLRATVEAPGYVTWDSALEGEQLVVPSEERREVAARLTPLSSK